MSYDFNIDWGLMTNVENNMMSASNNMANAVIAQPAKQQQLQMNNQQMQANQFKMAQDKFNATSQIFGSVALNPSSDSYAQALNGARKLGLDVSDAPQQWGQEAQTYAQGKLLQSGQGLEYLKAQAQMAQMGVQTTATASNANATAANAGQPMPFQNGIPGTGGQGAGGGLLGRFAVGQGSQPMGQATPASGQAVNGLAPPGIPSSTIPQGTPGAATPMSGPADLAGQKAQVADWQKYKSDIQAGAGMYQQTKQAINGVQSLIAKTPNSGPLTGSKLADINPDYQALEVQSNALNLGAIANFTKSSGISRLDLPLVKQLQSLTPGVDQFPSSNKMEVSRLQFLNEKVNAANQLMPVLENAGVRDPNQASQLLQNAVGQTQAFNPAKGSMDMVKFHTWSNNLPPQIKASFDAQNPDEAVLSRLATNGQLTYAYSKGYSDEAVLDFLKNQGKAQAPQANQ